MPEDKDHSERYEAGLATRIEVLGKEYVDLAFAEADEFTQDFQDYVTEFCWGMSWQNDAIDRRTRSLLTLTILAVGGKSNELRSHVRGALRNGATPQEIAAVFQHVAVYAGVPTAIEAFRSAKEVIAAWKENGSQSGAAN